MSGFVDPRRRYPLSETPKRTTRSATRALQTSVGRNLGKAATVSPHVSKPGNPPKGVLGSPVFARGTSSQSRGVGRHQRRYTARGKGNAMSMTQTDASSESEDNDSDQSSEVEESQPQELDVENGPSPEMPDEHNVSGTTLLPTDSEADTADTDMLLMIDSLPDLNRAASAILELFVSNSSTPSGISALAQALQDPKSSQSRRLQRMRDNFATQRDCFGDGTYLTIEQVASRFPVLELPSDSSAHGWRADGILYKSNCAQLALEILTRPTRTDDAEDSMYDLEGKYPLPFLNELASKGQPHLAGQSSLRRPTFDLALEMRTQFLMANLANQQHRDSINPQSLLKNVFYNESLETQASQGELMLRGFNLPSFQDRDGNLPERYVDDVQDRIRDIQEYFQDNGEVDHEGLEAHFPWEGFVYSVAKWLRSRNEELDRVLKQQPSVDDVRAQLEEAVNNRTSVKQTAAITPERKKPTVPLELTSSQQRRRELLPAAEIKEKRAEANTNQGQERRKSNSRIFSDQKSIQALFRKARALEQAHDPALEAAKDFAPRLSQLAAKPVEKTTQPTASTSRNTGQRPEETAPVASFSTDPDQTLVGDFPDDMIIPSPQRSQLANRAGQQRAPVVHQTQAAATMPSSRSILEEIKRHRKSRAFIDRQSNASRVSPIDTQQVQPSSSSRSRKRRVIESSESEDEYEDDRRDLNIQNRRAQKPAQAAKRQRREASAVETPDTSHRPAESTEPTSAQPPAVSTPNHKPRPATSTASTASHPVYSTQPPGRQGSPIRMPNGAKPPQVRRRWTTEEDKRLVELVGQYGTSWAVVKHQDEASSDPQLGERNQVQLKDRARNLVMIWLKGGRSELPRNFNLVTLKQKDVEELESRGISVPERPLPRNAMRSAFGV